MYKNSFLLVLANIMILFETIIHQHYPSIQFTHLYTSYIFNFMLYFDYMYCDVSYTDCSWTNLEFLEFFYIY
jgi:hypothetical protein